MSARASNEKAGKEDTGLAPKEGDTNFHVPEGQGPADQGTTE